MARYGFNVTIGADTSSFAAALRRLNGPIKDAQKELTKINQGLKLNPTNITLLTNKQKELKEQITQTTNKINDLEEAAKKYANSTTPLTEKQQKEYRAIQNEIEVEKEKLKDLQKQYDKFGSVSAQVLKATGQKFVDIGDKITDVGKKLAPVSAAASGLLVGITKSAIDFEDAWVGVTKTVEGTPEQLEKVRQEILKMASTTGIAKEEIAGVAQTAGQLGITTENLAEFTQTMIDLGISTNISAEEAATSLARIANITKMSESDYGALGAAITDLGNNYATTEAEIVEMTKRMAATGDIVGVTTPQMLALATSMSALGIEAEAGGSAMSKLLKKIQVSVETGDKNLNKFASVAGMTSKEFSKAFKDDAVGALNAFIKGLNDTERNGKSAVAILDEMKLKEVRLSNTILALANSDDILGKTLATSQKAWEEESALNIEAAKRYAETKMRIEQVKQKLGEIAVKIGDVVLPKINDILDRVDKFLDRFTELDDSTKEAIVKTLLFVAALSPLLIAIGTIISLIGKLLIGIGLIKALGIGAAIGKLGAAIVGFATGPVGLIILGITALIAIFKLAWDRSETFRAKMTEVGEKFVDIYNEHIKPTVDNIMAIIKMLWDNILKPCAEFLLNVFMANFQFAFPIISDVVRVACEVIATLIHGLTSVLRGIMEFIGGVFTGDWRLAWEGIRDIFTGVWNIIETTVDTVVTFIVDKVQGAIDKIKELMDKIADSKLGQAVSGIGGFVKSGINKIRGYATGGIVTRPQLAMVGEGGESEAIIPLSKLNDVMREQGVGGNTVNIYTQTLDDQKLQQIETYIDKKWGIKI